MNKFVILITLIIYSCSSTVKEDQKLDSPISLNEKCEKDCRKMKFVFKSKEDFLTDSIIIRIKKKDKESKQDNSAFPLQMIKNGQDRFRCERNEICIVDYFWTNVEYELNLPQGEYWGFFETSNNPASSYSSNRIKPLLYNDSIPFHISIGISIKAIEVGDINYIDPVNKDIQEFNGSECLKYEKYEKEYKKNWKCSPLRIQKNEEIRLEIIISEKEFSFGKTLIGVIPGIIRFNPFIKGFLQYYRDINVKISERQI
jgi:hypothetical protein